MIRDNNYSEVCETNSMRYAAPLFFIPACCHCWMALMVQLASPKILDTTTLHDIYRRFGDCTVEALLVAGILGFVSPLIHKRWPGWSFAALLPQQYLVILSSLTAIECVREGHFADGTPYDWKGIAADQCYLPILGLWHTILVALVFFYPTIHKWIIRRW